MAINILGKNLIAGRERNGGDETFTSVNPRTRTDGDVTFYNATPDEIDAAVLAADEAYYETRNYPIARLADFLDAVAEEIEALGDQLLETADTETALGIPRLTGERARTTGQLRAFGNLLREGSYVEAIVDTAMPDREPLPRPDIRRMQFPLGPVAVFSASNFPFAFAVAGGDTASAWAAGCPVVVKGHPGHPGTSELFGHAINRAIDKMQFPRGFFSLIQGSTAEVGQTLVLHPEIAAVGFTGSLAAGRAIYNTAASRERPIPVYAEMGSVNPIVILPGAVEARSEAIADGLVNSVTLGSGQFCTNPGIVLMLDGPETDQFIETVTQKMDEKAPGVLLNEKIESGLARTVATTLEHGEVKRLVGGTVIEDDAYCYSNTVLKTDGSAFMHEPDLQAEHFGPVTLFVVCESFEQLQEAIDYLHGNLTATVHAEDDEIELAGKLYNQLRETVGRLIWNGYPTGVEVVYAQQHGGPYPATTAPATTSVGMTAIKRFMRPVAFQNMPDALLPDALKRSNPLNIWRTLNGELTRSEG